jgi:hypothetical protein
VFHTAGLQQRRRCATSGVWALTSVENMEPEADERRFYKEMILLTINNRKTRFWVVARLHLRVVEHCSIEISFCAGGSGGHVRNLLFKIEIKSPSAKRRRCL